MTLREFMHTPNPHLDILAMEAENKRTAAEETAYEKRIEYRYGHYVVLDGNGNVYCSCDSHKEAMEEINDI